MTTAAIETTEKGSANIFPFRYVNFAIKFLILTIFPLLFSIFGPVNVVFVSCLLCVSSPVLSIVNPSHHGMTQTWKSFEMHDASSQCLIWFSYIKSHKWLLLMPIFLFFDIIIVFVVAVSSSVVGWNERRFTSFRLAHHFDVNFFFFPFLLFAFFLSGIFIWNSTMMKIVTWATTFLRVSCRADEEKLTSWISNRVFIDWFRNKTKKYRFCIDQFTSANSVLFEFITNASFFLRPKVSLQLMHLHLSVSRWRRRKKYFAF